MTEQFFRGVEAKFGRIFTRHTLGYISAAKNGLTEMELLDILACDDEVHVISSFFQDKVSPV